MGMIEQAIRAKAIELGKLAIRATTSAGSGHPTTALSLAHLITVLMYRVMRWDPAHPDAEGSDRLVLSEGHGVPIIYAACADLGVTITPGGQPRAMSMDDLMSLRSIGSPIDGHPNPILGFPFFDAATGSLGQGLSVSAGLATAARVRGLDKTTFCIMGDGEAREGQVWEAMDFVADHRLTSVVAIMNCNTLGQSDFVADAQGWQALEHKAEAFGWTTIVIDGHHPTEIEDTLRRRRDLGAGRPLCVIARTVKGWGVPSLFGAGHHGVPVPKDKLHLALAELDKRAVEQGVDDLDPVAAAEALRPTSPPPWTSTRTTRAPMEFDAAVAAVPKVAHALAEEKKMSPRRAFGLALKALGAANSRVVALDADVKNSTYALDFANAYPERYFEARIAEQNMVSAAAGLASGGMVPFASTFGRFLERAFDQIEMAIVGGANLKLVGTHVGVTLASDGPSQMAIADIGFMRAFSHSTDGRGNPSVTVLTPSDAVSAYAMVLAMADFSSACYLRAVRADLPILYETDASFPFRGHKVLCERTQGDRHVVLAASGYLVHSCLKAAGKLAEAGIGVTVVDGYALPMDADPVLALAGTKGAILVVEDNYVGGLASELAEAAAARENSPTVRSLLVHVMPKSGRSADDVLDYVHLSVNDIVAAATEAAR